MNNRIAIAKTAHEISACYPVMAELRPHLLEGDFVSLVKHLAEIAGFQLAYLYDEEIKAVAGFRVSEWLAGGKYLEIEDLVSRMSERSKGYGSELFDWLIEYAKEKNCDHLRLVSRTTRADAHRFYQRKGMSIEAYYFSISLK